MTHMVRLFIDHFLEERKMFINIELEKPHIVTGTVDDGFVIVEMTRIVFASDAPTALAKFKQYMQDRGLTVVHIDDIQYGPDTAIY